MKNIETVDEFRNLVQGDMPFCAVFSAQWCADCQILKAVLPDLEKEFGHKYRFAIVDMDDFMDLAQEYDVLGIPSFIVYKSGKVIDTFISTKRKTREEISSFLENTYSKM